MPRTRVRSTVHGVLGLKPSLLSQKAIFCELRPRSREKAPRRGILSQHTSAFTANQTERIPRERDSLSLFLLYGASGESLTYKVRPKVCPGMGVYVSRYRSQTTDHMHRHHKATMGLAGPSLGRELRAREL